MITLFSDRPNDCIFPATRYLTRRMRLPHLLPLLSLLLLFTGPQAHAQLKWDQPTQEFERVPEDKEVWVHYPFHNVGTTPVTIRTLRPSCGCTTARLEKKTYAPGESGDVLLHFGFGDRKGFQRKTVTVTTDDQAAEPTVLGLTVTIHSPVTINPALVYWKTGTPATAQFIQVAFEPGEDAHIKSVTSSNPRLIAKLDPSQPGQPIFVSVKPVDTTQKESAEISVQTDFPPDAPRTYIIHARIK